jgi:lipopolysaccharide transport system permease protein
VLFFRAIVPYSKMQLMSIEAQCTATTLHTSTDSETHSAFKPAINQKTLAHLDMQEGIQKWRVWFLLAYQDIKLRYRRSVLGPFWITISMAITVYSMGFLYAHLFHVDMHQYYPFLVAGMLGWALISTVVIDLTDTFINAEGLIKQIKLPYTLYIHRIVTRNMLIFFHNLLVMIPIFVLFHAYAKVNFYTLLLLPGLALIYLNAAIYGLILAMLGARYRDISQIIKSLVQVVFFVTPVMWNPVILPPDVRYIVYLNPFYSFLELIRSPLLGQAPTLFNVSISVAIALIGALIMMRLFTHYRSRIIYWL